MVVARNLPPGNRWTASRLRPNRVLDLRSAGRTIRPAAIAVRQNPRRVTPIKTPEMEKHHDQHGSIPHHRPHRHRSRYRKGRLCVDRQRLSDPRRRRNWSKYTDWTTATVFSDSLRKRLANGGCRFGNLIVIKGRIKSSSFDKDGETVYRTDPGGNRDGGAAFRPQGQR